MSQQYQRLASWIALASLMVLFFFYRDGARMVNELRHVLVRFLGPRTHAYLAAVGATTRAVVYGFLLTAIVQGTLAGLGYWVAGLGSPVMLGLITALFALIPFATPLHGEAPAPGCCFRVRPAQPSVSGSGALRW